MQLLPLLSFLIILKTTQSIKILGIFPLASTSHYTLANSLMKGLAEKGHNVTVISPFEETNIPKNGTYRSIVLTNVAKERFDLFELEQMNFVEFTFVMNAIGNKIVEQTLNNSNVQDLLKSQEEFDVVVVEQFVNDALKVFSYHYEAPLVIFVTFGSNSWVNPLVANPAPPSYVAEQAIHFNPKKFFHRLQNTLMATFVELNRQLVFLPQQNKIMKKNFPDAPHISELIYNASLVLLNSHVSTNKAVPRVPCMVDIGGFHISPRKQLPYDLLKYMDDAIEGVVYFSMGSSLQSVNLPVEKRNAILRVFSKLKQKVLWKWEDEILPNQPKNVKLARWLPQQDILAHPNIKAFITHGGLLSLIESVYYAVPMVAIPVYGDQIINAVEISTNELGHCILYKELDEEKLTQALNSILQNPKYKENMKVRSIIMHDRPNKPIDVADYWIQYVVRHRGAVHLRVVGLDLAWYQHLGWDVIGFIVLSVSCLVYVWYLISIALVEHCKCLSKNKLKMH